MVVLISLMINNFNNPIIEYSADYSEYSAEVSEYSFFYSKKNKLELSRLVGIFSNIRPLIPIIHILNPLNISPSIISHPIHYLLSVSGAIISLEYIIWKQCSEYSS